MAEEYVINTKITADSSGFEKGANKARKSTDELSTGLKNLSNTIKGIFAGGAIVKLGKMFSDLSMDFAQASSSIVKGTGATGDALKELNKSVTDSLKSGVGRSASEIGTMVADLNTRFGSVGDELTNLVDQFDMFSSVTGESTKSAINSVADVMNKWQISVEDSNKLLDQLVSASQQSGASVSQLTDSLKSGQSIFSQFGMNITQSTAFLATLSKNGIDTSNAILGLRTALAKFTSEGKNPSEEFKKISEKIKMAKDESEALNISIKTFGTRSGPEMLRVLRDSTVSFEDFEKSLNSAGGTLRKTEQASRTSKDAFEDLGATIKGVLSEIVDDNTFKNLIDNIREIISNFDFEPMLKAFQHIKDVISEVFNYIVQVALLFYQNIMKIVNKFISSLGTVNLNIQDFKNSLYTILNNTYKYFQDVFGAIINLMNGDFEVAFEYAKLAVIRWAQIVLDTISNVANSFPGLINKMIDGLNVLIVEINKIREYFKQVPLEMIKAFESIDLSKSLGLDDKIKDSLEKIESLTGKSAETNLKNIELIKDAQEDYVESSVNSEAEITDSTKTESDERTTENIKNMKKILSTVSQYAKSMVKLFNDTFKQISKVVSKIGGVFKTVFSGVVKISKTSFSEVLDNILEIEDSILTFFTTGLPELENFIDSVLGSIDSLLDDINKLVSPDRIKKFLLSILNSITRYMPNMITNLLSIFSSVFEGALQALSEWVTSGGLKTLLDVLISLQMGLEKLITDNIDSIVNMIIDNIPVIADALEKSIISASKTLSKLIGPFVKMIVAIIPPLIEALTSQEVIDASIEAVSAFVEALIGNVDGLVKIITSLVEAIIRLLLNTPNLIIGIVEGFFNGLLKMNWSKIGIAIAESFVKSIIDVGGAMRKTTSGLFDLFASIGKGLSRIFPFATGVNNAPAGLSIVGEQGPELIDFKGGERVYNASNTEKLLSNSGSSGNNFNVTFNNIQDTSAYTMMKQLRQYNRDMALNGIL